MKKKLLSGLLVLCLIFSLLPVSAFADTTASGKCGDNVTWRLDGDGTLTISGTGAMEDYDYYNDYYAPWMDFLASIEKVVISKGVTSIGNEAFKSCNNLRNVTIPDSVTSIGGSAFRGCDITSLKIPDGVKYIGPSAFSDCELETINIPNGLAVLDDCVFSGCWRLKQITIPNSVTKIEVSAFNRSGLESIVIPKSVTSIGDMVFQECTHLSSVTLPSSIKTISDSAFLACESLTNIVIPDGIVKIGDSAFYHCKALNSITIPASVKSIGFLAFNGCDALKDVYYLGTNEQWQEIENIGHINYALQNSTIHFKNAHSHSYANGKCTICGAADPNYKPAPKAPELKITTSAGKPKISWSKVDGATKYYIYRSTDGKNYKQYTSTTKTSYTNTSTTIGTTYYYKVKAAKVVNGKNVYSVYSNVKSVKCVPAAPVVSISRSNGKPKLTWKAVTGADKYYIYRSTDGKTYKQYTSTTKTSYTNTGAASGKKYYYKVKAVAVVNKKNVFSAYSAAKNMMTTIATPSVSITTANGKPKLTWKAVTGADKYYVYRSTNGKDYTLLVKTTKTSVTNTGAKKGTKYYYKVKAVCSTNTNANSAFSTVVSIKATK